MRMMPPFLAAMALGAALLLSAPAPVRAQSPVPRAALVIGNAAYPDSDAPLTAPSEDVRAVKAQLERQGFTVALGENLTRTQLLETSERFLAQVGSGTVAFVYFTGFAIQSGRQNYLLPVDAQVWSEGDVGRSGLSVARLLGEIDRRGAQHSVVVLDAAFRNPFERRFRSYSTGLAPVATLPQSATLLYSTAPGALLRAGAGTGAGPGPFAAELARQLAGGPTLGRDVFERTRQAVASATGNEQTPWVFSSAPDWVLPGPSGDLVRTEGPKAEPANGAARTEPSRSDPPRSEQARNDLARNDLARNDLARNDLARNDLARTDLARTESSRVPVPASEAARTEPPRADVAKADNPKAEPRARDGQRTAASAPPGAPAAPSDAVPTLRLGTDPRPASTENDPAAALRAARRAGTRQAFEDVLRTNAAGSVAEVARAEMTRLAAVSVGGARRVLPYSADDDKVVSDLSGTIRRNPSDVAALYTRGQVHAVHYDFDKAARDFDAAIRINAKDVEALNNRCWVRAILDQLDGALSDCNAALELRPNFLDALDSRGFLNLKIGLPRRAVEDYDAALKVSGSHASALYGRGMAWLRLGEPARGSEDIRTALSINPGVANEFASFGMR